MQTLSVEAVTARLKSLQPSRVPGASLMRRAAVAAIMRDGAHGAEVLFIQRAEVAHDPWSGHMAFPGGRRDPEDAHTLACAQRETREEVGLDLEARGSLVGKLSQVMAQARGKVVPLVVRPFVFALDAAIDPALKLNAEVQSVLWIPIAFFLDAANREQMTYSLSGVNIKLPCYHYEGRTVWGLTLKMLDELVSLVR
jgi:8-oxo-dGTP pyrophosphatase MutT (NUDIX family)